MPVTKHSLIESYKELNYKFGMKLLEKFIPDEHLRRMYVLDYIVEQTEVFEDITWKEIMRASM